MNGIILVMAMNGIMLHAILSSMSCYEVENAASYTI